MKLCTFESAGERQAGIVVGDRILSIAQVNLKRGARFPTDLLELIESGQIEALKDLAKGLEPELELTAVRLTLPYPRPGKIWCIGLNYKSHAEDINAVQPEEPGAFMKPSTSIFEPGGYIELPPERLTKDVDAEGELAIVFGKRCREVPIDEIDDVIFGYTTTLDLTALDILAKNPRYLQRSKSFDTFFSFGPVIVTKDEIADVNGLEVITKHNGAVFSRDFVRNMRHLPAKLASFHTDVMTFEPGDILSTGCPKGARIKAGDTVEAYIDGVGSLSAKVKRRGE
ncbi:MAG: fumarylacetoacetate hydrolase [Acidobacteria bacterium]|nr:fumarylacetoacetate hydrolase [Acidobacteriota bacterium]